MIKNDNTSGFEADAEQIVAPAALARAQILFAAAVVVIIAGVILPFPESYSLLLDGLWVLTLCLSAAIVMISVLAKSLSELSGFPAFVVISTLLRLGVAVASAKSIMLTQSAGKIIEKTGYSLIIDNASVFALVIPVLMIAAVVLIFMATAQIAAKAAKFASDTLAFKFISVQADLNAGVIDQLQADEIKNTIRSQGRFYLSMAATARFIRFDGVLSFLVVSAAMLGSLTFNATNSHSAGGMMEVSIALALGMAAVVFIPAVSLAFCCGIIVNKKNLKPADSLDEDQTQSDEAIYEKRSKPVEIEILNPDFVEVAEQVRSGGVLDIIENIEINPLDDLEISETQNHQQAEEGSDVSGEIDRLIMSQAEEGRVVALLGSESVSLLPVTIGVNIAAELAENGKKTLLIDADATRNAVFKVFDIQEVNPDKPVESFIENLSVWSVAADAKAAGIDLADKIAGAENDFDCIVIYAPNIEDSNYYGKLAGLINAACLATGKEGGQYIIQLKELFASTDCKCIVKEFFS